MWLKIDMFSFNTFDNIPIITKIKHCQYSKRKITVTSNQCAINM